MDRPSEHFTWEECRCKCGCITPPKVEDNIVYLCEQMEVIRSELGLPIVAKSVHRCATRNKQEGGADGSLHLDGLAMDFKVRSLTGLMIKARLEALIKAGKIPQGGIGLYKKYPNLAHYDPRGTKARWVH